MSLLLELAVAEDGLSSMLGVVIHMEGVIVLPLLLSRRSWNFLYSCKMDLATGFEQALSYSCSLTQLYSFTGFESLEDALRTFSFLLEN
ncbi:vacuolar sorting protein [Trifolium repens]|nr:vacuolar sorting protein [Trifolium repens]